MGRSEPSGKDGAAPLGVIDRIANNRCPFCKHITGPRETEMPLDDSCVIDEIADFAIVPDIAPLAPFHLLIITRKHVVAMATYADEIASIKARIREFYRSAAGSEAFFFEHGGCSGPGGSQCIEHAHVHAIPLAREQIISVLSESLRILGQPSPTPLNVNYLYGEFVDGIGIYWPDRPAKRQFFRILIANARQDSDSARWQSQLANPVLAERAYRWRVQAAEEWRRLWTVSGPQVHAP